MCKEKKVADLQPMQSSFSTRRTPPEVGAASNRQWSSGTSLFFPLGSASALPKSFLFSVGDQLPPRHSGVSYSGLPVSTASTSPASPRRLPRPAGSRPLAAPSHRCPHSTSSRFSPFPPALFQQFLFTPRAAGPSCTAPSSPLSAAFWFSFLSCSFRRRPLHPPFAPGLLSHPPAPPASRAANHQSSNFPASPPPMSPVFNHFRPSSKPSQALYLAESSRAFQALTGGWEEGTWGRAQAGGYQLWLTRLSQDCLCSALLSSGIFARIAASKRICFFNTFLKNKHGIALFVQFICCSSFNSGLETDCERSAHTIQCWEMTPLDHTVAHSVTGTPQLSTVDLWV